MDLRDTKDEKMEMRGKILSWILIAKFYFSLFLNFFTHESNESLIILLGENNLICVTDTGKMKFVKKLDYTPLSFCN